MWAKRILIASAISGAIVMVRIALLGWAGPLVLLLLVGLSAAWTASLAAVLLSGLAILERARRSSHTVVGTPWPAIVVTVAGAGISVAMFSLQPLGFNEETLLLGVAAGAVAVGAATYRNRVARSLSVTLVAFAFVILGFNLPREGGLYSLRWNSAETNVSLSWNGGENCSGYELGGRAAAIAPYRPDYVIISQLDGPLGERINESFGDAPLEDQYRAGVAQIHLTGHLDYGSGSCYLPMFKSDAVQGSITSSTQFNYAEAGGASLNCSASHTLSYDATIDSTGIASCHDLSTELAKQIANHLHNHAKAICGH